MREPPDRLTKRVWLMLDAARTSSMTREEATEQTILCLRRNLRYMARREYRGRQTRYDEALERDLDAIARLIVLLEPSSAAAPDGGSSSCKESRMDIQQKWYKKIALTGDWTALVRATSEAEGAELHDEEQRLIPAPAPLLKQRLRLLLAKIKARVWEAAAHFLPKHALRCF